MCIIFWQRDGALSKLPSMKVEFGIDRLLADTSLQALIKGRFGYLCHSASVDATLTLGVERLSAVFGERFAKIFGPQHGFVTDVQDNMVETHDFKHPYFGRVVHSLYGETRIPTDKMLEGLETIVVDLQDVGTRVYTYISTLNLLMEKCAQKGIRVVVLDRPNPARADIIEGAVLDLKWKSFVGQLPIPQRHGLTMGEVALFIRDVMQVKCDTHVITMNGYKRNMLWEDTGRHWVNPSPNLSTSHSCLVFPGTVLFEGTKLSEGRGTTRALEVVGSPNIEAFGLLAKIDDQLKKWNFKGITLRPLAFWPTFQKHQGKSCGGFHIHVTDSAKAQSWRMGQFLLRIFKEHMGDQFHWQDAAYEYEFDRLAIDLINGGEALRHWVENDGSLAALEAIEALGMNEYLVARKDILLYS